MSGENVEMVRRSVAAYGSGDFETAMAVYDPEVVFDPSFSRPEGGVYHGPQGVLEGVQAWVERWTDYRFEVEEIIDAGDRVLMIIREFGRDAGSGIEVSEHVFWVQRIRDGKIVRADLFTDRSQALEAAGLSE